MRKTAQEASIELQNFMKLLLEDESESVYDTGCMLAKAIQLFTEIEGTIVNNCVIHDVSGSLLSDTEYWKQRCQLAEKCIEESPCDPDITSGQIEAYYKYNYFLTVYGNYR